MISHERKIILIHIPKTGGTSIENMLDMYGKYRHLPYHESRAMYSKYWDKYFKFSFIRNPWDRLVSIYHFYKFGNERINRKIKRNLEPTFGEFIMGLKNNPNHPLKMLISPQKDWVYSPNGELMVDFLGRFENYENDINKIFEIIGGKAPIRHDRKSVRGNYRDYYTPELVKIVEELCRVDIEFFGYKF